MQMMQPPPLCAFDMKCSNVVIQCSIFQSCRAQLTEIVAHLTENLHSVNIKFHLRKVISAQMAEKTAFPKPNKAELSVQYVAGKPRISIY